MKTRSAPQRMTFVWISPAKVWWVGVKVIFRIAYSIQKLRENVKMHEQKSSGWMGGWMEVKAVLVIPHRSQKPKRTTLNISHGKKKKRKEDDIGRRFFLYPFNR